ncbi:MAG: endonuclease/exonuclease/phosphatase family protein [Cyanobacteria bacterium J06638_38]
MQKINEIRIDQPSTDNDEYFELLGDANSSLDGLTYLVIGDGAAASGSGVIENVTDLSGQSFDANGFFVAAESTFTLGTANLTTSLDFENSDNVTHLLVENFTGASGDDLDTDDDGVLDTTPFDSIVDSVALIETVGSGEQVYSETQVGPDGSFVPGQVFRLPDGTGDFEIGAFDPIGGDDTPGTSNGGSDPDPDPDPDPGDLTPIFEIQGAALTSPLEGSSVTTSGIVTAVESNGFYLQDPTGDGDDATADGVFVFTSDAPGVTVGDELEVSGTVSEFTPGGVATGNLSTTQISSPSISTLSTGNSLPSAVIIGNGGRVPPTESINDDPSSFNPDADGIDFFESLEGMLVTAQDAVAVSGNTPFGEIFTAIDGGAGATGISDRGTLNISPDDFNPERVQIDEDVDILPGFDFPVVDTGDSLGDVTGVVTYSFGNFEINPTQPFTVTPAGLTPESSSIQSGGNQLTVASYNVLNLDPNDGADLGGDNDIADGRVEAIASDIVNDLNAPDIIGLQEIQDNDGAADEGGDTDVVAADETLQLLIDSIAANGGPQYEFIDNTFITDDANGGEPGGNIRTAYLYNPDRVDLVEGSVASFGSQLPGGAFEGSRLPLVAGFEFNGQEITVVNNHFTSKGGSSPILGVDQPFEDLQEDFNVNGGLDERIAQAQANDDFVDGLLAADPDANVVVLGDLNEFEFISPVDEIIGSSLTNLVDSLPENERYSFIFQGNSQVLDHILISDSLVDGAEFDIVHVNAEFAATDERASDHDPLLASLTLPEVSVEVNVIEGTNADDNLIGTTSPDLISGGAGQDTLEGLESNDTLNGGTAQDSLNGGEGDDLLNGGSGSDTLEGLGGNDTLNGEISSDTLIGGEGDDLLDGGIGADFLDGSAGNDTLIGDNSRDTLIGGEGDDLLNGGLGEDTFVIAEAQGSDVIEDFDNDVIGLTNGLTFAELSFSGSDILLGEEVLATLTGFDATSLTESDFTLV